MWDKGSRDRASSGLLRALPAAEAAVVALLDDAAAAGVRTANEEDLCHWRTMLGAVQVHAKRWPEAFARRVGEVRHLAMRHLAKMQDARSVRASASVTYELIRLYRGLNEDKVGPTLSHVILSYPIFIR